MSGSRKHFQRQLLDPYPVQRNRDSAWCWLVIGAAGVVTAVFVWWPR
jgi:hypothetical protein